MSADLETRLDRAMKPKRARKPKHARASRVEEVDASDLIRVNGSAGRQMESIWLCEAGRAIGTLHYIASLPCADNDSTWSCAACLARRALIETGNLDGIWDLFRFFKEACR